MMSRQTNRAGLSGATNLGLWALQILTAVAFLAAGYAKLSGQPMMVATFDKIGAGQWFRYVTGVVEVASAILLLTPRLAPVGALLLVGTMIGGVLAHLLKLGGSPLPAIVLGGFAGIILWGRRGTLRTWLGKPSTPAAPVPHTMPGCSSR